MAGDPRDPRVGEGEGDDDLAEFGLNGDAPGNPSEDCDPLGPLDAQRLASARPIVRAVPLRRVVDRQLDLNFNNKVIAPGATETFSVTPQVLFRADRLIIVESIPGATTVEGLFVGNASQLPAPVPSSSPMFAPNGGAGVRPWATCDPALTISAVVRNDTAVPVLWSGTLFGKAAPP